MRLVNVVGPCYRYGHFLRECVQSVTQRQAEVRVLIIDDESADNTAAACREAPRVTYRRR